MKNDLMRPVLVCLLAFSWACTGTPDEDGADTDTPTPDAGTPDAEVDTDTGAPDSWSFSIVDQELDEDDPTSVAATSISTTTPSWIVVHEDDGGDLGAILGQVAIGTGDTASIEITLSRPAVDGELLHASLHVDEGAVGTFEYPDGVDVPVLGADGEPLSYAFNVTVPVTYVPEVVVADQISPLDGEDPAARLVTISSVVSATPGWLVVHAQRNDGTVGLVIGKAPVNVGENENVTVALERELNSGETLYAMLHTDAGEVGTYEFPDGADVPVEDANGDVIAPTFLVDIPAISSTSPWNAVSLDALAVERAVAAEASWLVVREETEDDMPGDILGTLALPAGESADVEVPITARPLLKGETVYVQLYAEDDTVGSFEGTEELVVDLDGDAVQGTIRINVSASAGPSLYVVDQPQTDQNRVTLDQIVWEGTGNFTHIAIYEGDPSDPDAYLPEALGVITQAGQFVATGREVTLSKTLGSGTKVWVVLVDDTMANGLFDSTQDMALMDSNGEVVSTTFTIID